MQGRNLRRIVLAVFLAGGTWAQDVQPSDKLATIAGKVTNSATGEPLLRAHVVLEGYVGGGIQTYRALTMADGGYTLSLPPGVYTFSAQRVGFVGSNYLTSEERQLKLEPGAKRTAVDMKLTPTGSISGRVMNPSGEPAEKVQVSAVEYGRTIASTSTDDEGGFRIASLAPGKYRILANIQNSAIAPEIRTDGTTEVQLRRTFYPGVPDERSATRINLPAGTEVKDIEIHLLRAPIVKVSGVVRGLPQDESNVMVTAIDNAGFGNGGGMVQADGSFAIWRLDPGRYQLSAQIFDQHGLLGSAPVSIEVGTSNIENIQLAIIPPASVSGQLEYDDDQAKPLEGQGRQHYQIWLQSADEHQYLNASRIASEIAADGSFELRKVQPARYRVRVSTPKTFVKSMRLGDVEIDGAILDFRSGLFNGSLTVRLSSAGAEISGTVQDDKGSVAGARVVLGLEEPDHGTAPLVATSDAKGAYSLRDIPPEKYRLLAVEAADGTLLNTGFREEYLDAAEVLSLSPRDKLTRDLKLFVAERQGR